MREEDQIDLDALLARLKMVMDTHPDDGGQVLLADGVEDCYEAITRLRAELAALKAQPDPLAEMWRELEEYQPLADRDGHGESWAKMCEERTDEAAWAAYTARQGSSHVRAAAYCAWHQAQFDAEARRKSKKALVWATDAVAAIRRAKEVQNG